MRPPRAPKVERFIDIAKLPVDAVNMYPDPFWHPIKGRERKRLGNAVGLSQFGLESAHPFLAAMVDHVAFVGTRDRADAALRIVQRGARGAAFGVRA